MGLPHNTMADELAVPLMRYWDFPVCCPVITMNALNFRNLLVKEPFMGNKKQSE